MTDMAWKEWSRSLSTKSVCGCRTGAYTDRCSSCVAQLKSSTLKERINQSLLNRHSQEADKAIEGDRS